MPTVLAIIHIVVPGSEWSSPQQTEVKENGWTYSNLILQRQIPERSQTRKSRSSVMPQQAAKPQFS